MEYDKSAVVLKMCLILVRTSRATWCLRAEQHMAVVRHTSKDAFQWISVCLVSKASGKTSLVFFFLTNTKKSRKPNGYYIFNYYLL